jgi:hypothetical protein
VKSDPDPIYEVQTCTACGSFYSPLENSGGCLGCAARFALAIDAETADYPFDDSLQDLPQLRKYGHFEIAVSDLGEPIELGHGAMGTTYRGWDTVLHTPVALKVINISVADHPEARTRFIREARAAAQLRHPNIAANRMATAFMPWNWSKAKRLRREFCEKARCLSTSLSRS